MKKLEAIRDQLSDIYKNWDDDELVYKEGFDAGVIEMQKIVEPLVDILRVAQKALVCYSEITIETPDSSPKEEYLAFKTEKIITEALQKYKEAIE